jgi:hypothetical protein
MITVYNTELKKTISINENVTGQELKKIMIENNIFSLKIENGVDSLDFLNDLKEILIKLSIDYIKKLDYTKIESLNQLSYLSINTLGKSSINFSNFIKLEYLYLEFDKNLVNLDVPSNLNRLTLRKWKKNSEKLSLPNTLKRLEIISNHFENIDFMENNNFIELGLYYMPKLESLQGIFNNKNLKKITLQSCKRFKNYEEFLNFPELEEIIIEDCGLIESIQILKKIPNLKSLQIVGNNDLKDKEIDFIKDLDYYYVCGEGGGKKYHERYK